MDRIIYRKVIFLAVFGVSSSHLAADQPSGAFGGILKEIDSKKPLEILVEEPVRILVAPTDGTARWFVISPNTKLMLGDKFTTIGSLQVGQRVVVAYASSPFDKYGEDEPATMVKVVPDTAQASTPAPKKEEGRRQRRQSGYPAAAKPYSHDDWKEQARREYKEKMEAEYARTKSLAFDLNLKGTVELSNPLFWEIEGLIKRIAGDGTVDIEITENDGTTKILTFGPGKVDTVYRMAEAEWVRVEDSPNKGILTGRTITTLNYDPKAGCFTGNALTLSQSFLPGIHAWDNEWPPFEEVIKTWQALGDKDVLGVKSTWTPEYAARVAYEWKHPRGLVEGIVQTWSNLPPDAQATYVAGAVAVADAAIRLGQSPIMQAPPPSEKPSTVHGFVIDRNGKPLTGARVSIIYRGVGILFDSSEEIKTDDNGFFQAEKAHIADRFYVYKDVLNEQKFNQSWNASKGPVTLQMK